MPNCINSQIQYQKSTSILQSLNPSIKMNKLILITTAFLLVFVTQVSAQNGYSIAGKINNNQNKALASIQITLTNANDNSVAKIEITDADGNFAIQNLKEGNYKVVIDDMEYSPYQSETISLNASNPKANLAPIILTSKSATDLNEVVIKKKKPFLMCAWLLLI